MSRDNHGLGRRSSTISVLREPSRAEKGARIGQSETYSATTGQITDPMSRPLRRQHTSILDLWLSRLFRQLFDAIAVSAANRVGDNEFGEEAE